MSLKTARREIDSEEFAIWQVWCERFEPFGRDWRLSFLLARAVESLGVRIKGLPAESFLPDPRQRGEQAQADRPKSPEAIRCIFRAMFGVREE